MRYAAYDKAAIARQVKTYVDVERNYRNASLTTADTAEALGIARSTLIQAIKEGMETTFADYLDKCRVHHARHHIVQRRLKEKREGVALSVRRETAREVLTHIALLTGHRTLKTFVSKYVKEYGEKPSDTLLM